MPEPTSSDPSSCASSRSLSPGASMGATGGSSSPMKSVRGAPVSDAQVFLTPKAGEAVTLKTNVLGLYRSHVNKDVMPDDVAVSCEKSGYKQDKVFRRTPPGAKDMFIETDCTLRRL